MNRLSPSEQAALDSKLSEALILYYDGRFGQALPIFGEIASKVETMDIMWWIGTSAMKAGDLKRAEEKFRKMLSVDPGLARVRLELAAVYFQLGRYRDAEKELHIVKASGAPEEVLKNIDRLLGAIDEATKKFIFSVRASQGLQWDSNVSSGPDKRELNVTGGMLTLSPDSQKMSGWASITNIYGSVLYDLGERQGFAWNTSAELYKSAYFDYSKYNYALADVATGPWWIGKQDIVKVPIGYTEQEYGGDRLSSIVHFDPNYEHFFTPVLSLRSGFSLSKEIYYDGSKNSQLDNTTRRYEIGPNFYLDNRKHMISLTAGYEELNADAKRFSYTARYSSISWLTRFPTRTELFLRYQYAERDYKDAPILYTEDRLDRRHTLSAVISQQLYKNLYASFSFNYIDNKSNTELYRFDKMTHTLSLGFYY